MSVSLAVGPHWIFTRTDRGEVQIQYHETAIEDCKCGSTEPTVSVVLTPEQWAVIVVAMDRAVEEKRKA